jgi:ABC-type multidrug transport system fused ATPase/permease subunit
VALLRLVELSSGEIKIDGLDIADINLEQLHTSFSVIPQEPVLFDGTIR